MSIGIEIDRADLAAIERVFASLSAPDRHGLMEALAVEGGSQTRRRISQEKSAPDGSPWAPWTDDYAATRHGGHSLLEGEGDLLDSITAAATTDAAMWGSNLPYAAIHQYGGTPDMPPGPAAIPERPYLGLSAENADDLLAVARDWLDAQIGGR
ncbi:phage virion morphogenesis protein [Arhodomonas sp. AD133]|uniref:phage virion morphogenesis protein n=1 Tax=Arhodomonas sp. AD133 TaxID=3415009 RepID=UPI003EBBD851